MQYGAIAQAPGTLLGVSRAKGLRPVEQLVTQHPREAETDNGQRSSRQGHTQPGPLPPFNHGLRVLDGTVDVNDLGAPISRRFLQKNTLALSPRAAGTG
ncbi:MAG: hypothetical protein WDO56_28215 [Gammaproteobacteria bacterium]